MSNAFDLTDVRRPAPRRHAAESAGAAGGGEHAMHKLQREAGNAAVTAELQREEDQRSPVLGVVGRGGGSSLPAALQRDMEARIGHDFSDVRVHSGGAAAESAAAVGARAYTTGNEVVLGDGVDLSSDAGQHTLAHELTHVVQQRNGPVEGTASGDGVAMSDPGDRFEREAESNAHAVMSGGPSLVAASGGPASASAVQRHAEGDGHDHGGDASVQTLPLQREGDLPMTPEDEMAKDDEDLPVATEALQRVQRVEDDELPED